MDNLFSQVVLIENYGLYIDILLEDPLEDLNIPIALECIRGFGDIGGYQEVAALGFYGWRTATRTRQIELINARFCMFWGPLPREDNMCCIAKPGKGFVPANKTQQSVNARSCEVYSTC